MSFHGMKCLIILWCIGHVQPIVDPIPFDHGVLQFISLGYLFKPIRAVKIYSEIAHMYFHISLPTAEATPPALDCTASTANNSSLCSQLLGTHNLLLDIRWKTQIMISNAVNLANNLTECLEQSARAKRYPSFLANIFASLSGLSKSEDVDSLRASVARVQNLTLNSMASFTAQNRQIASLAKIQGDQLQRLDTLTRMSRDDLNLIQQNIDANARKSEFINTLQYFVSRSLYKYTEAVHQFALFQNSLEFFSGKLTSYLIPVLTLRLSLKSLQEHLDDNHQHLSIVNMEPTYYYRAAKFNVFRKLNDLIIRVDCPLATFSSKFTIFQLVKLPLSLPTDPNHYSILNTPVKTIALNENYYITFNEEISYLSNEIDISDANFEIKIREITTCETALFTGDSKLVMKHCDYTL